LKINDQTGRVHIFYGIWQSTTAVLCCK